MVVYSSVCLEVTYHPPFGNVRVKIRNLTGKDGTRQKKHVGGWNPSKNIPETSEPVKKTFYNFRTRQILYKIF